MPVTKILSLSFTVILVVHSDLCAEETAGSVAPGVTVGQSELLPQYRHNRIVVPAASADESLRDSLSVEGALAYVEDGAAAWNGANSCVACHTTGVYLGMRPLLTKSFGPPSDQIRQLFVSDLEEHEQATNSDPDSARSGIRPAAVANIAWGLAEWDAQVTGLLSAETRRALSLMFRLQNDDGSFANEDCWPPFESSDYQAATVAAMAVATAPGWKNGSHDKATKVAINRLRKFLQTSTPPHTYARILLLRAALRWPELMDRTERRKLYADMFALRNADGGWSMRDFAEPEQWGAGGRAEKLRSEPEFEAPPSDAHMTALVMIAYLEAGMDRDDRLIRRGVAWLKSNQRVSGRWWTRSLNTDKSHYITYSASLYALVALERSGSLPGNSQAHRHAAKQ